MSDQKTKIRKSFNYLIRAAIIIVTYSFIYRQVFVERKLQEVPGIFSRMMEHKGALAIIALILLLMLVNWGIESLKWQLLIAKIEKVPFFRAFKAVMTGVSVSLFMPNRTGDYMGRIFILEKGNHLEGIFITLIGSFAQLIVTFSIGLFCFLNFTGEYLMVKYQVPGYLFTAMIFIVPVFVFLILLFYFNIRVLSDIIRQILPRNWERFKKYSEILSRYNSKELLVALLLSMARYIVFTAQFFLLLTWFGTGLPLGHAVILIPVIYLVMAIVPSFTLTELGVRGSASLFIIGLYFVKYGSGGPDTDLAIVASSSLLWFINLIIPAVMGTFFVFNLKFFRK